VRAAARRILAQDRLDLTPKLHIYSPAVSGKRRLPLQSCTGHSGASCRGAGSPQVPRGQHSTYEDAGRAFATIGIDLTTPGFANLDGRRRH